MFSFLVASLLLLVIGALAFPFFRQSQMPLMDGQAASIDDKQVNLQIERRTIISSLSELEVDFGQGKLLAADYDQLKLGFEHRLLEVLDGLELLNKKAFPKGKEKGSKSTSAGKMWVSIFSIVLLVGGGSTGVYQLIQWKLARPAFEPQAGGMPRGAPIDPKVMVARLEKKLKENPDNLQGQLMIGRSYMAMERWDDAGKAWTKVLELDPRNYTAHYRLGEIILSNPKTGTREEAEVALAHFDKALISVPQDPSILWARGIVLLQLGRVAETDEVWTEAFQYIPRNTESSNMLKKALEDLRAGRMPSSE